MVIEIRAVFIGRGPVMTDIRKHRALGDALTVAAGWLVMEEK